MGAFNYSNINSKKDSNMMGIGTAAIGAGAGLAQNVIGMIGQRQREKRANKQNEKMQRKQQQNQMALNEQGKQLSMDMWNETNYEAQMEHMKAAGLNPSLMYGQGGGGGTTASAGSGGSASGGGTIQPQSMMDIGAIDGMMKMAQIKNIDADTKYKEEQTGGEHERGVGQYLDNMVKRYTMGQGDEDTVNRSRRYGEGTVFDGSIIERSTEAETKGAEDTLKNMEASRLKDIMQTVESEVNGQLGKAKINLTDEQARKIYHDIIVNYVNAGLKGLDTIVKGRLGSIGGGKKK